MRPDATPHNISAVAEVIMRGYGCQFDPDYDSCHHRYPNMPTHTELVRMIVGNDHAVRMMEATGICIVEVIGKIQESYRAEEIASWDEEEIIRRDWELRDRYPLAPPMVRDESQ